MQRYVAPKDPFAMPEINTALPVEKPIAIYYRQSAMFQVGNISTSMQTVDMVEYISRLGWNRDLVTLIDMDEGMSGSKKIDERPGMSLLFSLITEGKIGAVACQDEDRLFRDVTQIQVNVFIEACRANNVRVLTPTVFYDFAHPLVGTFHMRQFRFKSEMAAEYIDTYVRKRLVGARRRLLYEGRWTGANTPRGYMVDLREKLSDGARNPQYRRYVPFPPFVPVILEYFRLFVEQFIGNVTGTVRYIAQHGPYYPTGYEVPDGFHVQYVASDRTNGKNRPYPTVQGMRKMLTNVAYIGHWPFENAVVQWDTHEPIIPEDLFMRAYNYLSTTTVNGEPNPHFVASRIKPRLIPDERRKVGYPLFAGLIVFDRGDKWHTVGAEWDTTNHKYAYRAKSSERPQRNLWQRRAYDVDSAITRKFFNKLEATFDTNVWGETLEGFESDASQEKERLRTQLRTLEQVRKNLLTALATLDQPEMIRSAQTQYQEAEAEQNRLLEILSAKDSESQRLRLVKAFRQDYSRALKDWPKMNRQEKRLMLEALITRIEAEAGPPGILYLTIHWFDDSSDNCTLATRGDRRGRYWLPEEKELLAEMVKRGATPLEIAAAFPDRTWDAIGRRLMNFGATYLEFPRPYKGHLTYEQYREGLPPDRDGDRGHFETYTRRR